MIKRNIVLLCMIALLQGMVFYAPVATLYRQAAGLGIFDITLIESISLFLTICLEIPWGWTADRIGYRRTILICCGLYFASKILFWQADSFSGFLLERILLSIVCSGLSGVDSSMLYLSCREEDAHRVFSIYQNLQQTGLVMAAGIYALWVGENYRLAGFLTLIPYGIAACLAFGLQEVKRTDTQSIISGRKKQDVFTTYAKSRNVLLLVIGISLVNETHQMITVFLSQLQYSKAGMSHRMISLAYIAVSIFGLSGGFSAKLCRKTGARRMGELLILGCVASCVVLTVTVHPLCSVLAVVGLRGCFSLLQPLYMDLQHKMLTTSDRATALSIHAAIQEGMGIFLNLVFGRMADQSISGTMLFGAGICLMGVFVFEKSQKQ